MDGMNDTRPLKDVLSPTMYAITAAVADGRTNRSIAEERGTTEQVIKNYLRRVFERAGVASRLELANRYAFEHLDELRGGVAFGDE